MSAGVSSGSDPVAAAKKKTRILIADQEGVFRLGLKKLFGVEDDLYVVAQADKPAQIQGLAGKFKPDLLFIQADMLGPDPTEMIGRLQKVWPGGKTVVILPASLDLDGSRFVKAGAVGVISRATDPDQFVKNARALMRNGVWPQPLPSAPINAPPAAPRRPVDTLTRREKTIIACLIQGWRNREIAQRLQITEQTVKNHLRAIFDKVGVSDRLELALYAIHQKLELPPAPQTETST